MRVGLDMRGLVVAEVAAATLILGLYGTTLITVWSMLHVPGYYAVWATMMFQGYSFLLVDSVSRFIQNKLGYGIANKKASISALTFVLLAAVSMSPNSLQGLMNAALQTWLFLPMVLTLTPGLATLGVLYYTRVFKKDIDKHTSATENA
ncbi:MAG: hypothetical protein ABSG45_09000 [Nitrososphaerales archaeon]